MAEMHMHKEQEAKLSLG